MSTDLILNVITQYSSIIPGLIFAYFGYRLLFYSLKSPTIKETEFQAEISVTKLQKDQIIRVVPGTFFSLLGAALILVQYKLALIMFFLIISIVAGVIFCISGYSLFQLGVFESSDVDATFKDFKLLVKRASPGTLFAVLGAVIIVVCLWKGTGILNMDFTKIIK